MEEKLNGINGIDKVVGEQSQNIEIYFIRVYIKLIFLFNKLKGLN